MRKIGYNMIYTIHRNRSIQLYKYNYVKDELYFLLGIALVKN